MLHCNEYENNKKHINWRMSHKTGDNLVIRCSTNMKNQTEAFFIFDLALFSALQRRTHTDYGHATNHLIYCITPSINIFFMF